MKEIMKKFKDFTVIAVIKNLMIPWAFVHILYSAIHPELEDPSMLVNYIPAGVMILIELAAAINECFIQPHLKD